MKEWGVLIALLIGQLVLAIMNPPRPVGGDEPYYVNKARTIMESGSLPRAQPIDLAVERGAWATRIGGRLGTRFFCAPSAGVSSIPSCFGGG